MRASTAFFLGLLLIAPVVMGQEEPAPAAESAETPDYSRDNLLRLFADQADRPEPEPAIRFRAGAIEFLALGTAWRFVYLPIMLPLSGSRLTTSREFPDPFSLTNTAIATTPRSWRTQRERNREMRRIEESERARIRIE